MTLDQLITQLQTMKNEGLDGSTLVGIPDRDNNARQGMIQLAVQPRVTHVAKDEHAKGWTLCRVVSRGGEKVLVLGG
ncbi:hypothetical protein [Diaphorobacter sp. LR2014-1]|uniref:hypothetical protein n=1 Tax=Diaphorobacter sp. LR2014-1 TaxID=1933219 RepID=UPI000CDB3219|nr:hypothetical protein [Diaphorobacter sp. LR2014-1]POR07684.1 hypothetical protein BV908_19865 [Diaphorobacter sp. LR2014-1]